jgi:hypothetical protein
MSNTEVSKTEIGKADEVTMDSFVRTLISQYFDNDNDTGTLDVVLNGTGADKDPNVELEIRLVSINGVKTEDTDNG